MTLKDINKRREKSSTKGEKKAQQKTSNSRLVDEI
jgi:hypothetical protein